MTSSIAFRPYDLGSVSSLPKGLSVRRLAAGDLNNGVLQVLGHLTVVEPIDQRQFEQYLQYLDMNKLNLYVLVIHQDSTNKVAAVGTVLIERKLIHGLGVVGHIEDIAVSEEYQGQRLGQTLIAILEDIARSQGAYKCILNCSDQVKSFYEKCSYSSTGHMMVSI